MPEPFCTRRLVEFHDTDMAGIMHFASFFIYMESAEHELLRSLGFSVHSLVDDEMISFPRVSSTCNFVSPARSEEILDISISVNRLGRKSITYDFHFSHEGRAIADGKTTCVCCTVRPGHELVSRAIPAEISDKLRRYVA